MIADKAIQAGFRVSHFPSIGSTMDEAMACAQAGESGNLWIVADEQIKGRGRHGRTWVSEPGNLYASLLLVDPCPIAFAPQLGFVAGLALHDAITASLSPEHAARLKWPNDVLVNGAKISGILLEGAQIKNGNNAVVIGIGVNIMHHPADMVYPTTSLRALAASESRDQILMRLSAAVVDRLAQWQAGNNFAAIRMAWSDIAAGIGTTVEVRQDAATLKGIFREIDAEGRMVLDCDGVRRLVHAGDVYLNRT